MKSCSTCKRSKPLGEFPKSTLHRGGYKGVCKACTQIKRKQSPRADANPTSRRKYSLSSNYNLTVEQFDEMVAAQENKCAICGTPGTETAHKKLYVDHCHKTKLVRKLLCGMCNSGLGYFKDSPELLENAKRYLVAGF